MDQEKPQGKMFCRHELARTARQPRTLHERMMVEAEHIIQHNWTDVAIHDRDRLRSAPVDHAFAWMVGSMGSYLTPMYCRLSDRKRWTSSPLATLAPIQIYMTKLHEQFNALGSKVMDLSERSCYLVIKRDSNGGDIIPLDFQEFAGFCTLGKWKWTKGGFQRCK
jgi:hypothetical protein